MHIHNTTRERGWQQTHRVRRMCKFFVATTTIITVVVIISVTTVATHCHRVFHLHHILNTRNNIASFIGFLRSDYEIHQCTNIFTNKMYFVFVYLFFSSIFCKKPNHSNGQTKFPNKLINTNRNRKSETTHNNNTNNTLINKWCFR